VRRQIAASLRDLQAVRGLDLGEARSCVVGAMCTGTPTCALVIYAYGTEAWTAVDTLDVQRRELLCR
jgi:hypothetical protein